MKQNHAIISTDGGMQIDLSDEQPAKADSPRVESLLPLSNVTLESFSHPAKQNFEMISTEEGMQIACSDLQ
jgi:hypothetical protein